MNPARPDIREQLLHRIATALTSGPHPHTAGSVAAQEVPAKDQHGRAPHSYRTTGTLDTRERLDLFTDRLHDYKAGVHPCTPHTLTATVTGLLDQRAVHQLVLPPRSPVDLGDWPGQRRHDTPDAPLTPTDLDAADTVLTGCATAIAETATIVLDAAPDQGRRMITLIPDHHIVVVHAHQIVQTVPEALHRLDPTRPLTWISGPSATSDIELSRVEGVHGPRQLDVVLVGPTDETS